MTVHVGLPQLIYVLLTFAGLLIDIRDHGKPRKPENAWNSVLAVAIVYSLLIWGGFFK